MRKIKYYARKFRYSCRLIVTLYIIMQFLVNNVAGGAYCSMVTQPYVMISSPPVILEEGNCSSTATIYANKTSAKVSVLASRNWWNPNYSYRRQISIVNNLSSTLSSGYSVCLTLDTASLVSGNKMLSGGDDLRIVYGNGSSWVEIDRDVIDINTSSTQVWFKTQAEIDSSATDNNYYIYYGNPFAGNPPANKSEVYLWFDDFSTNTTNKYDIDRHADDWHGAASNIYKPFWDSSNSAIYFDTDNDYAGGWMPNALNDADVYAEMKMKITGSYATNTTNGILLRWQNKSTFYGGHISGDSYTSPCLIRNGRTTYIAYKTPSGYHAWNQWFTLAVAVWGSNLKLWVNGVLEVNGTDIQITASGKVSFLVSQAIGWMDDFKIRKYVEPEPFTSLGSEERNIEDYVDNNTSDVDSSSDKGTHGNFSAEQAGPDLIYDTLMEGNNGITVNNWGITSSAFTSLAAHTNYRYMGGTSPNIDNMTVTKLHIRYNGTGKVAIALYTGGTLTDPTGATKRTEAYNVSVFSGWNIIDVPDYNWEKNTVTWIGWCHSGGSVYYSASPGDAGDFQLPRGRWNQTAPSDADETSPMPTNPGSGSFSDYWYAVYVEYETPNYEVDLEVQWTNMDYDQRNEELAIYVNKENTLSMDATGGYMIIGDGTPNWGSVTGTISFWVKWDTIANRPWGQHDNMEIRFSGSNLVVDWGAAGSITSRTVFVAGKWYFIAVVWNENTDTLFLYVGDQKNAPREDTQITGWTGSVSTVGVTQNNFMASKGGVNPTDGCGDELRYWNIDRTLEQIQSDYNIELTGSETNLRSYFKLNNDFDDIGPNNNDGWGFGSYSFSYDVPFDENLQVDVWNGTTWQNILPYLTNGWNNVSVSSYLNASIFTIRFKGNTETGDFAQDNWSVDAALLHVWTIEETYNYDYVLKVINQVQGNWAVNLKVYSNSNISCLSSMNISLHDGTSSNQIALINGSIVKSEGEPYDLPGGLGSTIYICVNNIQATISETSYLYVYLKILIPSKSTYLLYIITFEIT